MDPSLHPILLATARSVIAAGATSGHRIDPDPEDVPAPLREPRACFVTLEKTGQLRGCIGTLTARRPLIREVAAMAYASAFEDPRFSPVTADEVDALVIAISVLGAPEPLPVSDEADLLAGLRPGDDGLILEDGRHRATFLPSVWEQLPEPADFVRHLKRKAGLPDTYWSESLQFSRYGVELIKES